MLDSLAYKRRAAIEAELDEKYLGRLVRLPDNEVVRVETTGVEWAGKFTFTVTIHGGDKRRLFDYADFSTNTKIIR